MEMPKLVMSQQYAMIGIQTQNGHYQINQPQAEISMQTTNTQVRIENAKGMVEIDQEPGWGMLGVGSNPQWNENIYSQMNSIMMQGILRRSEDGNRMIEAMISKDDPTGELADKNSKLVNSVDYTVSTIEKDGVKLNGLFKPGKVDYQNGSLTVQVKPHKPQIEYHRGAVDLYVRQKNSLNISVSNSTNLLG